MKLFTPVIAKQKSDEMRDKDIVQAAHLSITLESIRKQVETETKQFQDRLAEQREIYTQEKVQLQQEVRVLQQKIAEGETRLAQLLIPIDGMKEHAETARAHAEAILQKNKEMEIELDERLDIAQQRIDELDERELRISAQEAKIESRIQGINEEAEMIASSHKKLNDAISLFKKEKEETEKFLSERERTILIIEQRNKEYLKLRTEELDTEKIQLKDLRETLDRGFAELKRLQNKQK